MWKLAVTHTPDPFRPMRWGRDFNWPTRGLPQGIFSRGLFLGGGPGRSSVHLVDHMHCISLFCWCLYIQVVLGCWHGVDLWWPPVGRHHCSRLCQFSAETRRTCTYSDSRLWHWHRTRIISSAASTYFHPVGACVVISGGVEVELNHIMFVCHILPLLRLWHMALYKFVLTWFIWYQEITLVLFSHITLKKTFLLTSLHF